MKPEFSPYGPDDKILPDVAMLNKLSFNGFHGRYYDHEQRFIDDFHFPTTDSVEARGFKDGFPNARDLAEGLYNVYGDTVGEIRDNAGNMLYDDLERMLRDNETFGYNGDV